MINNHSDTHAIPYIEVRKIQQPVLKETQHRNVDRDSSVDIATRY